MRRLLFLAILCFVALSAFANHPLKVVDKYNKTVLPPVLGTKDCGDILPRRCLTGNQLMSTRAIKTDGTACIPTGLGRDKVIRIPVVLAEFTDRKFTVKQTRKAFAQFFNAQTALEDLGNGNHKNHGSVKTYFHDMSQGEFVLQFDIYGTVELPHTMGYYGGQRPNDNKDERSAEMVLDATRLIEDSISDASIYDANGDGFIDCVYVIYAGLGQNHGGEANTVWACTSRVNGELGNRKLGYYSVGSELQPFKVSKTSDDMCIAGIGVTCHELSHAMGLPDIYPLTNTSGFGNHNQNMEYWDLMDGGEYRSNGWRPTPYTAWEKSQFGWPVAIKELDESQHVTMPAPGKGDEIVYKIPNHNDPNEYFLLENIQENGWNQGAQGHGLLMYHVYFSSPDVNPFLSVNATKGKPNMAIVPADGRCYSYDLLPNNSSAKNIYFTELAGDPFPGRANATELTDLSNVPNFHWYTQDATAMKSTLNPEYFKTDFALKNIVEADGAISFDFYKNISTALSPVLKSNGLKTFIYDLNGLYMGKDLRKLPQGIYIVNRKKVVVQ